MHPAAGWIGGMNVENPATASGLKSKIVASHGGIGTNGDIKGYKTTLDSLHKRLGTIHF